MPSLGGPEMLVVLVLAVLLFGKRLPEVGRSLGKGIVEFKKGVQGIEEEIHRATQITTPVSRHGYFEDRPVSSTSVSSPAPLSRSMEQVAVPKFEPPATRPSVSSSPESAGSSKTGGNSAGYLD
ncbi:twin-arginine translocation protein, TatA/E family subunit [Isosphaera pallida ATCC 43644]|uniref:Sec-independent protein translocase protein TatA n=1 Tax=Isosphaera pallida (strain ATCC 43644 / DSM 9630 / IS1B) TaxID=575540 RepID=E8R173_ISOPI|nr:twin-arginine translocase TatA/TatE family subunit [Isosphaera pallida]ADV61279.1 twin-arginine translocation protein, TatA/E family subunit [Isosphaera pallida ATCC 43644]